MSVTVGCPWSVISAALGSSRIRLKNIEHAYWLQAGYISISVDGSATIASAHTVLNLVHKCLLTIATAMADEMTEDKTNKYVPPRQVEYITQVK